MTKGEMDLVTRATGHREVDSNGKEGSGDVESYLEKYGSAAVQDVSCKVSSTEIHRQDGKDEIYKGYGFSKDLSVWTRFQVPILGEIRFNPVVSLTSLLLIWGFVVWCILERENVPFSLWKSFIVENFTWLYIGSQDIWALFLIVLYFSKYGDIKLGKPNDKPEYNDASWFMMLFACGIGVGLFFYGVGEPILHYTGKNRFTADPTTPDNILAQSALNVTLYHWGIHGWVVFSVVGLLLGLLCFRENLPMTMKACFYPLIGDRIYGWIGDLVDILSIMTTLFGVCTSLGLGTRQINAGLHIINPDIDGDNLTIQVITIWCITAVATLSTVSGVGVGIRRLSELCFMVGMFIMCMVFFLDETSYILNLYVQTTGYYLQNIIQLGWHTDAFEQLGESIVSDQHFVPEGHSKPDGPPDWMDNWTVFYWGWWISWCPFVGMFIAKISRGRTIRQYINGTITAPVMYSLLWLILFGGVGIRQERTAANMGMCCPDNNGLDGWILKNSSLLESMVAERGVYDKVVPSVESISFMCNGSCADCATKTLSIKVENNFTFGQVLEEYKSLGHEDFGSASVDRSVTRLSCHGVEQMWFDVMRSFSIGYLLTIISLLGIMLYFVTSSDSGSLVIDCLSSNGDPEPPRIQRVFWALMEGAMATALLVAGGEQGLVALQTVGVISGLPYTFVICLLCTSIWRAVQVAAGDLDPFGPSFACGLFDAFGAEPFLNFNKKKFIKLHLGFWKNIFLAPLTGAKVAARVFGNNPKERRNFWPYTIPSCGLFLLFILFHGLETVISGCWAIAWFFFICFCCYLTVVRLKTRDVMKINGNAFEDFFASLLYPCAALQMDVTTECLLDNCISDTEADVSKRRGMTPLQTLTTNDRVNYAYDNKE